MDPLTSAVGGYTLGLLIGYAARKVASWILTIIGIFLLVLYVLYSMGVIMVNWSALGDLVASIVSTISSWFMNLTRDAVAGTTFGLAMIAGFATGFFIRAEVVPPSEERRFVRRRAR